jgi:hypothetical protein
MAFPSLNVISHLWRFHRVRGVYVAIFRIHLPFPGVSSSINRGYYRKNNLLLADHFLHQLCQNLGGLVGRDSGKTGGR